jgi:hypothetical protein
VVAAHVAELRLGERYCGPPASSGGDACGTIAGLLGGGAEVTLRRPPPLGRLLRLRSATAASLSPRPARPTVALAVSGDGLLMEPMVLTPTVAVVVRVTEDSASRGLIIRLIIHSIRLGRSGSVWTDEALNVSRPDRSGPDQIDAEHQATDLAVGGSNPSRRAQRPRSRPRSRPGSRLTAAVAPGLGAGELCARLEGHRHRRLQLAGTVRSGQPGAPFGSGVDDMPPDSQALRRGTHAP